MLLRYLTKILVVIKEDRRSSLWKYVTLFEGLNCPSFWRAACCREC